MSEGAATTRSTRRPRADLDRAHGVAVERIGHGQHDLVGAGRNRQDAHLAQELGADAAFEHHEFAQILEGGMGELEDCRHRRGNLAFPDQAEARQHELHLFAALGRGAARARCRCLGQAAVGDEGRQ